MLREVVVPLVYKKTAKGQQVLNDRSIALPHRQRMAFILFDGRASVQDILATTQGIKVTMSDIEDLFRLGLIEAIGAAEPASPGEPSSQAVSASEHQSRYQRAYPLAVQLTAGLGIRGFKLNLAVEAAMGYAQLLELLPKIQQARGLSACAELEAALLY